MESGDRGSQRLRFQARLGLADCDCGQVPSWFPDALTSQLVLQMKLCRFLEQHWGPGMCPICVPF